MFWKPKEENEPQDKLEQHRITVEKLANKLMEFKMKRRHRLREITKMGSRAFWRLVRKVFDFKGEQLVTAAYTKLHKGHAGWIKPECEEDKHEAEVCRVVLRKQVEDLVGKMKDTRASGTKNLCCAYRSLPC